MRRTFIAAKLHGLRVTGCLLDYHGSVGISRELLDAVGIRAFERVSIVNVTTGARWDTYALPLAQPATFTLQGGSARLGMIGDACVVMTWATGKVFEGARVAILDEQNSVIDRLDYPA